MDRHRIGDSAFTRRRKLTVPKLIGFLLNLRKQATQVELDQYFAVLDKSLVAPRAISKSAFSQARNGLSPQAFVELNHQLVDQFYREHKQLWTWHGLRLCAIDGSKIRLPDTPQIVERFGVHRSRAPNPDCPMALASVLYDVYNGVVIDSIIAPGASGERDCAAEHLAHCDERDCVLYDRGYNAFWLYKLHEQRGIPFCMRATTVRDNTVKAFLHSDKREQILTFKPGQRAIEQCNERKLDTGDIRLRAIRVDLPDGVEVLLTNLFDRIDYPAKYFKDLYHQRWTVEEFYKTLKCRIEVEAFSGKSSLAIEQDYHAKILAANLINLLVLAAQEQVDAEDPRSKRKHLRKVNVAHAVSTAKQIVATELVSMAWDLAQLIDRCVAAIARVTEIVRPDRKFHRPKTKLKRATHRAAYKTCR